MINYLRHMYPDQLKFGGRRGKRVGKPLHFYKKLKTVVSLPTEISSINQKITVFEIKR